MHLRILCITHKVPGWIKEGYHYFAKRLPPVYAIELIEIPAAKRGANGKTSKIIEQEDERMLAVIKPLNRVIALEMEGEPWSSAQLSNELNAWQQAGKNIDFLIGGPDGLGPRCLHRAERKWSLSSLTFPHAFVRLILAEQLYRAYSLLHNHPYHRG